MGDIGIFVNQVPHLALRLPSEGSWIRTLGSAEAPSARQGSAPARSSRSVCRSYRSRPFVLLWSFCELLVGRWTFTGLELANRVRVVTLKMDGPITMANPNPNPNPNPCRTCGWSGCHDLRNVLSGLVCVAGGRLWIVLPSGGTASSVQ